MIQQTTGYNASTIKIYGADGNTELTENGTGYCDVDITVEGVLSNNTSLVYAIKNPLTYIYNSGDSRDWYTDNQTYMDDALWADGEPQKSTYDPCPKGWEIPTNASLTFGDMSIETTRASGTGRDATNGRMYQSMTWFPLVGRRNYDSGILRYVGGSGCYWSSSISDIYVQSLYYDMSGVYPSNLYFRAYGFSVRCIQE